MVLSDEPSDAKLHIEGSEVSKSYYFDFGVKITNTAKMVRVDRNFPKKARIKNLCMVTSIFNVRELFLLLVIDVHIAGLKLRLEHASFILLTQNTKPSNFMRIQTEDMTCHG
jgi:hypothetical protein